MAMDERVLRLVLDNFWRLTLAALMFGLGLIYAIFGLTDTLVILALTLLGWLLGKWRDEGRPTAGLARRIKRGLD